ncbi:hypothetical protein DXG03_004962 [Asterophora parasitica]|uniref:U6 snRNA phosphodiesterase 1 n=1 Tax=Asterophora parasitica TaxID=117018 RepID=A0A9P7KFB5_9AGAR|nr:hypothetical protein DXG03_004962 [Asterophora parasitica]
MLVNYSSSDGEEEEPDPPAKRRKLPSLSSSMLSPLPIDRLELHQGRIRTNPHVEGQWVAHVYVSLVVDRRSVLSRYMDDILTYSKTVSPTLNDFWSNEPSKKRELHISLSRPTYLRAHQREDLKKVVKTLSETFPPFTLCFATFSELINDERTRAFLTMELQRMAGALTPALQAIRQKEYYSDPRFHASIAWVLLDRPSPTENSSPNVAGDSPTLDEGTPRNRMHAVGDSREPQAERFITIPHLPGNLVSDLNELYGAQISSTKAGAFDVDAISVKIGKEVYTCRLSGT